VLFISIRFKRKREREFNIRFNIRFVKHAIRRSKERESEREREIIIRLKKKVVPFRMKIAFLHQNKNKITSSPLYKVDHSLEKDLYIF